MTEFTTWRSLVDGKEIIAIPDSEVNPDHRYVAANEDLTQGESMSTLTDMVGDDNLSASGDPTYGESEIGDQPGAVLDPNGPDFFTGSFSSAISQPYTIFAVFQTDNGSNRRAIFENDSSSDEHGVQFFFDDDTVLVRDENQFDTDAGTPTTDDCILTVQYDASDTFVRVNGTQVSADVGDGDMTGLTLGYDISADRRPMDGPFSEWLIDPSAVSSSDIDAEEQRLSDFYDISLD